MAQVEHGKISSIMEPADRNGDNTRAKIIPSTEGVVLSQPLIIPWWMRGKMGNLEVGTDVAYILFDNMEGVLLSRLDGEWTGEIPGDVTIHGNTTVDKDNTIQGKETVTGTVTAQDLVTAVVASHNSHTHGGVESGGSSTTGPS